MDRQVKKFSQEDEEDGAVQGPSSNSINGNGISQHTPVPETSGISCGAQESRSNAMRHSDSDSDDVIVLDCT